jgi:5-amino-6-(5-phospho-D-ribitylamino)uracil phosphatase
MVALDIDGTLVDRNGFLPPMVAEAVALIMQAGVPAVLSTGRSWHGTKPVFDELGLPPGPTVCSNGAVVMRYPPQEIIKAITFDPRPVIAQVEEFAPGTGPRCVRVLRSEMLRRVSGLHRAQRLGFDGR